MYSNISVQLYMFYIVYLTLCLWQYMCDNVCSSRITRGTGAANEVGDV